jgi:hypothetical protein
MRLQSRRFTEWFWIALTYATQDPHTGKEARHGLQLSTNTVGALESIVWVDGQMFEVASPLTISLVNMTTNQSSALLPGQRAIVPARNIKYDITSADGSVQLEYIPRGVLPNTVRTPLVYGSFFHSYGVYRGTVTVASSSPGAPRRGLKMERPVAGIFEDHSVHW